MERVNPQTKACACQAMRNQKRVSKDQLHIIQQFLSIGNANRTLRDYVLEETNETPLMWDQMLIFLALVSFRPQNAKLVPTRVLEEMWHTFILCTREYATFCNDAAGRYLHHVPSVLVRGKELKEWFQTPEHLTKFLNGSVPEYCESRWYDKFLFL